MPDVEVYLTTRRALKGKHVKVLAVTRPLFMTRKEAVQMLGLLLQFILTGKV